MNTSVASSSFLFWHLFAFYLLFLVIYQRTMHYLFHAWRMWVSGARSVGFPSTVHHLLFLSTSFFLLLDVICFAIPLAIPSICISFVLLELYLHVFCLFGMGFGYQVIGTGWPAFVGVTKGKWLHYQTCIAVDAYIQRAPCVPQGDICFETCRSIYCRLAGFFQDKPPGHGSGVMSVFILLCLF